MDKTKQLAIAAIEAKASLVTQVSDAIWDYAELSLQEEKSAEKYCEVLKKEGFTVEKGICNIPTAFSASFGSGRPVIGLLAEYDALSGLSQKGGALEEEQVVPGGCGHGCGHNMLGARDPRHRHPLRLPRGGGGRSQGLYGPGRAVEESGRRPHLASGGRQRGGHWLL